MPYLKLSIPSVSGTAVFWNNLRHTGADEYFTMHAGCPVMMGSKMIMSKWIHSFGQEFRRPCRKTDFEDRDATDMYKLLL